MGKNGTSVTGEHVRTVKLSYAQSGESREVKIEGKKDRKERSILTAKFKYIFVKMKNLSINCMFHVFGVLLCVVKILSMVSQLLFLLPVNFRNLKLAPSFLPSFRKKTCPCS